MSFLSSTIAEAEAYGASFAVAKRFSSSALIRTRVSLTADPAGVEAARLADLGRRHEAVVGGQDREVIVLADRRIEVAEELLEHAVELEQVVVRQARLGAPRVVDVVVAGEADAQDVGDVVLAELLAGDRRAREGERQLVDERAAQQAVVEGRPGLLVGAAHRHRQLARPGAEPGLAVRQRRGVGRLGQVGVQSTLK